MDPILFFVVAVGGGIGAFLRHLISILMEKCYKKTFPLAVLVINCLGCMIFAIITHIPKTANISEKTIRFVTTGFCGGFSTWSTLQSQTIKLHKAGSHFIAAMNLATNHILGYIFAIFGAFIGKKL